MNEEEIRKQLKLIRSSLIFKRGNKCEVCGCIGGPEDPDDFDSKKHRKLLIHHKKPIKEGGDNQESNLQVVCFKCHSKIHNHGCVIRIDRKLVDWLKDINENVNKALYYLKGKYELDIKG